jgi:hypothetical protein
MGKRSQTDVAVLIARLCDHPAARLVADGQGVYRLEADLGDSSVPVSAATMSALRARGLLFEAEPERFAAAPVALAWLKRRASTERPFRHQHGELVETTAAGDRDRAVLVDLEESPVASLARRAGKNGEPWLSSDLAAAAERLRRDFELGQLQPRITANWSASVSDGRRSGDGSGLKDLTDLALAARLRFDRAMRAVGPELSGVLVDICCFLKGLETVERERQWPGRSAKLVLRMALTSLARHYGLSSVATGKASGEMRHWGEEDYRPVIG